LRRFKGFRQKDGKTKKTGRCASSEEQDIIPVKNLGRAFYTVNPKKKEEIVIEKSPNFT
jgi:hypothetical protein